MIDKEGKIIDGDDSRVQQAVFSFSVEYNGNHLDDLGHPWEIT